MTRLMAAILALTVGATVAAEPFEDGDGRFVIDLPDGYAETARQVSSGVASISLEHPQGPKITLLVVPIETGFDSPAELLESQLAGLEEGLGSHAETRQLHDIDLGSYPARWGWMTGTSSGVDLDVGIGALELDGVQVGFMTMMSHDRLAGWGSELETAFLTIRPTGDAPQVVANKVAATRAANAAGELVPPSTYTHTLFTLDLPAGWSATTNSENPRAINMASLAGHGGASGIVMCLTGLGASRKTMDQATRGSLTGNLPNIRHVSSSSVRAANGKKANINVFEGRTEAEGRTVVLHGFTASLKHRKCWLGFIGFGVPATSDQHLDELRGIVQSVR